MKISTQNFSFLTMMEGMFFAIMVATSESYALYYFTKKGLSTFDIALLSTIPLFMASIIQLIYPRLIKEKFIPLGILATYILQILGLSGIIYSAYHGFQFPILLASLICYWVGGQNSTPLLMDWYSHFIPERKFGNFLSTRNVVITLSTLIIYIAISLNISSIETFKNIFWIGLTARVLSSLLQLFLFKTHSYRKPKEDLKHQDQPLIPSPFGNSAVKTLFIFFFWTALFRIAVNISSPFFLPYMVNELKMSIQTFVILTSIPLIGRALFLHNWGRSSPRGIRPFWGIQISCFIVASLPALWLVSSNSWWLAFLQIISGIFWSGYEMSNILMVQSVSYKNARALLGLHQALMTLCSVAGSLLGAYLLKLFADDYHMNFLISSGGRYIVSILFIFHISHFPHFRLSMKVSRLFLYSILSLRPSLANIGRIYFFDKGTGAPVKNFFMLFAKRKE